MPNPERQPLLSDNNKSWPVYFNLSPSTRFKVIGGMVGLGYAVHSFFFADEAPKTPDHATISSAMLVGLLFPNFIDQWATVINLLSSFRKTTEYGVNMLSKLLDTLHTTTIVGTVMATLWDTNISKKIPPVIFTSALAAYAGSKYLSAISHFAHTDALTKDKMINGGLTLLQGVMFTLITAGVYGGLVEGEATHEWGYAILSMIGVVAGMVAFNKPQERLYEEANPTFFNNAKLRLAERRAQISRGENDSTLEQGINGSPTSSPRGSNS